MPTAYLSPSRLRDLTDVSVNPGSAQNNYPLTWNNTSGKWQASNNIAGLFIRASGQISSGLPSGIAIGNNTANSSGPNWIAEGTSAANSNVDGSAFIAQGPEAGGKNTFGRIWIAQGDRAGRDNTVGNFWFAQGSFSGLQNTLGDSWFAQGYNAALLNTTGYNFLAQGYQTAFNNIGHSFVAQGFEAGYFDTRSNSLNIANSRNKSLICGLFDTNCIYFGHPGGAPAGVYSSATVGYGDAIASSATVPTPTAAVHAAASNTTRASLRIDSGVAPTTPNTGDIWVNSSNNSLNFQIPLVNLQGTQVLATRRTGWTAPTGTATRTTFATFAGQDISATPTEAEVQAIDDHVKVLSERLKALIDDLTTHGLIGT